MRRLLHLFALMIPKAGFLSPQTRPLWNLQLHFLQTSRDLDQAFRVTIQQCITEDLGAGLLTMHQEHALFRPADPVEIGEQLIVICVT